MAFKEITHCVQRFEMLEERAGIEIGGLMVTVDDESDSLGRYEVTVMAEITATNGASIENSIQIHVNCHNGNGQICGSNFAMLFDSQFFGIDTLNVRIYAMAFPVSLKIIPKVI